jgi:hypothetical protein
MISALITTGVLLGDLHATQATLVCFGDFFTEGGASGLGVSGQKQRVQLTEPSPLNRAAQALS